MGIKTPFEPDTQLAEADQPRMGTLNNPAMTTKPFAAFNAAPGETGCDSSFLERLPESRVVVALVGTNLVRPLPCSATFACNWRYDINHEMPMSNTNKCRPTQHGHRRAVGSPLGERRCSAQQRFERFPQRFADSSSCHPP